MEGTVETVNGPRAAADLGMILMHEHLFLDGADSAAARREKGGRFFDEPLTLRNLHVVRRNPYAVRANLLMDDPGIVREELRAFRAAGGGCLVDLTAKGMGRRPRLLKELSRRTGVHIVAGCGYYTAESHPPWLADAPVSAIAREIVRELTDEVEGAGFRAGIIGEIGTGETLSPSEEKVLRAAAAAHRETRAAMSVHLHPWGRTGPGILDLLEREAVDPGKVIACHLDVALDPAYCREIARRGAILGFDTFQHEGPIDRRRFYYPTDLDRARAIAALVGEGYGDRIVLSNDICYRMYWRAYGGYGYGHVIENVIPMLTWVGLTQTEIDRMLIHNPQHILAR